MGQGFSKMKKQAKLMQEQMQKMEEQMQALEVTGSSGNGLVQLTLSGDKKLKTIKIAPECIDPEDVEGLEDLIKAAFNEAIKKVDDSSANLGFGGMPFSL